MRSARSLSLALATGALLTALSGCSIAVVDPGEADSGAPVVTDDTSTASDGTPSESEIAATGLSAEGQAIRDAKVAAATTTMPCPSEPLDQDGTIVRVEGDCAELVIEIDAGVVIADDVDQLTLKGSGTTVFVNSVKSITVTGSASDVYWAGDTPSVTDSGAANTIRKG